MSIVLNTPKSSDGTPMFSVPQRNLGQSKFLRTTDGSAIMHVDGTAQGSDTDVWLGTTDGGGSDWTVIGEGSEQAAAAHSGAEGWDTAVTGADDFTMFDNGADIDVVGTYQMLTFWMNPQAYPSGSKLCIWWKNFAGSNIGNFINVDDYVVNMDLGVWQEVSVPISDFNLTADASSFRFIYNVEAGQRFYFDDIKLNDGLANGPYLYRFSAPDATVCYHVTLLILLIAASETGWASTAFGNLAGGLSNGLIIRQRRISGGEILWSLNSKDNVDLFGRYHPQESFTFSNGEMLLGFMLKPGSKASVIVTDDEVLEFVVRDDLSTLNQVRAFAHYGVEVVAV